MSFSVPRCSRPMCGSAFWITSPSISSTRRSTPCAAGCCGPKFIVKLRISATPRRVLEGRLIAVILADHPRHQRARLDRHRLVDYAALLGVVADLDITDQREVLAKRMADEAVIGQQPAQVRVAVKQDAKQVIGLALEPIGR